MSTIKIKQVKSAIKRPARQKATIQALGFRKLNQTIPFIFFYKKKKKV